MTNREWLYGLTNSEFFKWLYEHNDTMKIMFRDYDALIDWFSAEHNCWDE